MPTTLQFVAALLLLGATTIRAQTFHPNNVIAPPPRNPAQHRPAKTVEDLQWMWQYTRPAPIGEANDLRLDGRFQSFLQDTFKQPQAVWGPPNTHEPLAMIISLFLTRYGTVSATDNRYISIDGCVPSFCAASGLLWIDLGRPHPLAVFAAVNWNADAHTIDEPAADYNLWLFPNRQLDADALPLALTEAISHWNIHLAAAHRLVPNIAHALLVEPDGSPFPLDPAMAGANVIAPQPDTTTPKSTETE